MNSEKIVYKIKDGSYAYEVIDGVLTNIHVAAPYNSKENKWYILAENCKLPADDNIIRSRDSKPREVNNTIVVNAYNNKRIVFTQGRFLKQLSYYCECCGQRVNN